jgi:YVTN family beta-propeller protein
LGGGADVFVAKIAAETTLAASPLVFNFREVTLGSAQDLSLTLQNTGEDTLTGTASEATSPFSVIAGGGSFSLNAGANMTVPLRFAPTSTGSFGSTLDISSTGGSATILLNGVGTASSAPALSVCSPNLNFGQVAVGQSVELTCTITNTGTGTLTGNATTVSPFGLASGDTFNLNAGQSQSVGVRFTSGSPGAVEDVLTVSSNGGSATIVLRGTGVQDPVLAVNPTRLNFGGVRVGQSRDLSLTVQNAGTGTLSRNVCVPGGFSVISADSFSLSAGQSQTVTISFSPSRASAFNATATFAANACDDPNPQPDSTTAVISGVGVEEIATSQAYVANRASDTVSVVNTAIPEVEATIPVGSQPVALALTPDAQTLYVVNSGSNDVSVIDTISRQEMQRIAVGLSPIEIVISADSQRAYVANAGPGQDSVSILDLANNQLLSTEKIRRPIPSALALSPDGKVLYVLGSGSQFVALLETATNQKARIKTGESPVAIAFSPDGDSAYVVNREDNTVSVLDTRTFPPSIVCDVAVEEAPVSVAVTPDGEKCMWPTPWMTPWPSLIRVLPSKGLPKPLARRTPRRR